MGAAGLQIDVWVWASVIQGDAVQDAAKPCQRFGENGEAWNVEIAEELPHFFIHRVVKGGINDATVGPDEIDITALCRPNAIKLFVFAEPGEWEDLDIEQSGLEDFEDRFPIGFELTAIVAVHHQEIRLEEP